MFCIRNNTVFPHISFELQFYTANIFDGILMEYDQEFSSDYLVVVVRLAETSIVKQK